MTTPYSAKLIFLTLVLFLSLGLGFFKYSIDNQIKIIIPQNGVVLATAPGENQAAISELEAGQHAVVLRIKDDYIQIRSAGRFSGWIKKSDALLLNKINWSDL